MCPRSGWVTAVISVLFVALAPPCAGSQESAYDIAEALDRLRVTQALWPEGINRGVRPGGEWKAREAVAMGLLESEEGAKALLEFCIQNPENVDLFIPASRAARHPELWKTETFVAFTRAFAAFAEQDCVAPADILYRLDNDALVALAPIWRAWVRGETNIPAPGESTRHVVPSLRWYFTELALTALNQIHDAAALADVLAQPWQQLPHPALAQYLYELGPEEAFPLLRGMLAEDTTCGFMTDRLAVVSARDLHLLLSAQHRFGGQLNPCSLWHGRRPDLERALLRWQFDSPKAVAALPPPFPDQIRSYGAGAQSSVLASVFSPRQLLRFANQAEREKSTQLPRWVEALGFHPGPVGNRELVRWATSKDEGLLSRSTQSVARRALLRRLVGPNRSALIRRLQHLGARRFGTLVTGGMTDLPVFYGSGEDPMFTMALPNRGPFDPFDHDRAFVRRHEHALLEWLPLVEPQWKLASIYALMASDRAHDLLIRIAERGNPGALKQAWLRSVPLPLKALRRFRIPTLPSMETDIDCLLLRAQAGDDASYQRLLDWFPLNNKATAHWRGLAVAVIGEMERRRDLDQIRGCIEASLQPGRETGTGIYWPRHVGPACVAALLRADPAGALATVETMGLMRGERLYVLLEGVAAAATPASEPILKRILADAPWLPTARTSDAGTGANWWLRAVEVTPTPWCRDLLFADGQSQLLVRLLDPRALGYPICIGSFGQASPCVRRNDFATLAMRDGQLELAARVLRDSPRYFVRQHIPFFIEVHQDYRKVSRQEQPPERFLDAYRSKFGGLTPATKMWVLPLILHSSFARNPEVVSIGLADPYGPVRLSFLLHFLARPIEGFEAQLRKMAANDPYPWCRRLAAAHFDRTPDPLDPETGENWSL